MEPSFSRLRRFIFGFPLGGCGFGFAAFGKLPKFDVVGSFARGMPIGAVRTAGLGLLVFVIRSSLAALRLFELFWCTGRWVCIVAVRVVLFVRVLFSVVGSIRVGLLVRPSPGRGSLSWLSTRVAASAPYSGPLQRK
jgi:hypothetical protein